mgnify:CR=1 FL=1
MKLVEKTSKQLQIVISLNGERRKEAIRNLPITPAFKKKDLEKSSVNLKRYSTEKTISDT